MNFKRIIQFNNLRSQLTEQELTLADALRTATEAERELLVESLIPQKQAKKTITTRKAEHCAACDYTKRHQVHKDVSRSDYHEFQSSKPKSAHAKSISSAIQRTPKSKVDDEDERCTVLRDDDKICGLLPDHNVHHMTSARGYHPFVSAADAVDVEEKLLANGEAASSAVNTEIKQDVVSTAGAGD